MQGETILMLFVAALAILTLVFFLWPIKVRFSIDGFYFENETDAKKYYNNQVCRGRKGTMISIINKRNNKLIKRVKCSEYFYR